MPLNRTRGWVSERATSVSLRQTSHVASGAPRKRHLTQEFISWEFIPGSLGNPARCHPKASTTSSPAFACFQLIGIEYLLCARRWVWPRETSVLVLNAKPVLVPPASITAQERDKMYHENVSQNDSLRCQGPSTVHFTGVPRDEGKPDLLIVFSSKKSTSASGRAPVLPPSLFPPVFLQVVFVF